MSTGTFLGGVPLQQALDESNASLADAFSRRGVFYSKQADLTNEQVEQAQRAQDPQGRARALAMPNLVRLFAWEQGLRLPVPAPLDPDVQNATMASDWIIAGSPLGHTVLAYISRQALGVGSQATVLWAFSLSLDGELVVPLSWLETQATQTDWGTSGQGFYLEGENQDTLEFVQLLLSPSNTSAEVGDLSLELVLVDGTNLRLDVDSLAGRQPNNSNSQNGRSWGVWNQRCRLTIGDQATAYGSSTLWRSFMFAPPSKFGSQWLRLAIPNLRLPTPLIPQSPAALGGGQTLEVQMANGNITRWGSRGLEVSALPTDEWSEELGLPDEELLTRQPRRRFMGLGIILWLLVIAAVLAIFSIPAMR